MQYVDCRRGTFTLEMKGVIENTYLCCWPWTVDSVDCGGEVEGDMGRERLRGAAT